MKHYLTVVVGGQTQQTILLNQLYNFSKGRLSMGRMETCDIVLPYSTVSRSHAYLDIKGDAIDIVDMGSLNKLRINGVVYDRIRLINGMKIVIGADETAKGAVIIYYNAVKDNQEMDSPAQFSYPGETYSPRQETKERTPVKPQGQTIPTFVGARLLALMIDYMIWFFMWFGAVVILLFLKVPQIVIFGLIFGIAIGWVYFALMESSEQRATMGKLVMGLAVVDREGNQISFGTASKRFFAKMLSMLILCIGFIPMFGKKQTLHDYISGCRVIKTR